MKNKLKEIRTEKLMTIDELAKKANVSRQTIYKIENKEETNLKISTVVDIAAALGQPVDAIFLF